MRRVRRPGPVCQARAVSGDLIGRRLTVRHRLAGADGSAGASDVIGRLLADDGETLLLERRDGSTVQVPRAAVIASRVVADRPARARRALAADAQELTRITSRGWPAVESASLGEWELRASAGFTGRANSVAVHGDPGTTTAAALAQVEAFYAARGLAPQAQVIVDSRWEAVFAEHGWIPSSGYRGGAVVQVADVRTAPPRDERVLLSDRADDAWLALYPRVEDVAAARTVLEGPRTVAFARIGDPVVAIARGVVTGEWAGLAAVEVEPGHRRQGLGDALVRTLLAWAHDRGATRAYLQTMPENEAALRLYAPYGFATHHAYRYLVPAR